jgi:hypothetical protein
MQSFTAGHRLITRHSLCESKSSPKAHSVESDEESAGLSFPFDLESSFNSVVSIPQTYSLGGQKDDVAWCDLLQQRDQGCRRASEGVKGDDRIGLVFEVFALLLLLFLPGIFTIVACEPIHSLGGALAAGLNDIRNVDDRFESAYSMSTYRILVAKMTSRMDPEKAEESAAGLEIAKGAWWGCER